MQLAQAFNDTAEAMNEFRAAYLKGHTHAVIGILLGSDPAMTQCLTCGDQAVVLNKVSYWPNQY